MFKRDNIKLIVIATVCVLVGFSAPAIGHGVHARFAHNADKVDGRHAVGVDATRNQRKGKLVATDGTSGRLPNNIIAKAPNANKLDGKDSTRIGVNGWERISETSAFDSDSSKAVKATCPAGKILVGTGFDIGGGKSGVGPNAQTDVVVDMVDAGSRNVVVVEAYEEQATVANWNVSAVALCAQAP